MTSQVPDWLDRPLNASGRYGHGLVAATVATSAILLVSGNVALAFVPALVVVLGVLALVLPLRVSLLALLAIVMVVNMPPQRVPGTAAMWSPPFHSIFTLLFENLNKVVGVDALRFSFLEVLFVLVGCILAFRVGVGARVDGVNDEPSASALRIASALSLLAVVWLEVWGVVFRHGDARQSMWQARQFLWLPVLTFYFAYAMRSGHDLLLGVRLLGVAAVVKIAIGIYYFVVIAWPGGLKPETMTTHDDSVLFVTVIVGVIIVFVHAPSRLRFVTMLSVGGWVIFGMALNNRRIAYVSLLACLMLVFILLKGPVKRSVVRGLVLLLPVLVPYVVAGRHHTSGVFKPASLIFSVSAQTDASSATRDIENFNLLSTLKGAAFLGTGWGHEYNEVVKAYDISNVFAQYRYIAHNSILWIWSIGGWTGFSLIWLPIAVGIFLARRAYSCARTPDEQAAAMISMVILITYVNQAWGDMGTQSPQTSMLVALALAASAKLAVATGAFPARLRFFQSPSPLPRSASLGGSTRDATRVTL